MRPGRLRSLPAKSVGKLGRFRTMASMEVEESIRGNPIDEVVLLMACDNTSPSRGRPPAIFKLVQVGGWDREWRVRPPHLELGGNGLEQTRKIIRDALRCRPQAVGEPGLPNGR